MRPTPARSPLRFGLCWLIGLALLLPAAQFAASWHGYAHVRAGPEAADDAKSSPRATHCDLCLAAAALGSGLPSTARPLLLPTARHASPPTTVAVVRVARTTLAYRSRAPPFLPR